ncbi:hypothetical protein ILYODFUR_009248 [Ilyodon furcidens]|uniref:Uncharacterized protein n=1 Tax=Ilyodon furcidens TaxID=33524 RepID=A0ABV0SVQ8_9TELE
MGGAVCLKPGEKAFEVGGEGSMALASHLHVPLDGGSSVLYPCQAEEQTLWVNLSTLFSYFSWDVIQFFW